MKTQTLTVLQSEYNAFKKACTKVSYLEIVEYDSENQKVTINYLYNHALYFLGIQFEMMMQIEKLDKQLN